MTKDTQNKRVFLFGLICRHKGMNGGGVAVCIRRLANYFSGQGCQVTILTAPLPAENPMFYGLDSGITHLTITPESKIGRASILLRHIISLRPKAILSFDTRANRINSWLYGIPFINVEVWMSLHNAINAGQDPTEARLSSRALAFYRKIYRRSTGVIAVSQGLKNEFLQLTGVADSSKTHVIYNPVVDDNFDRLREEVVDHPWFINKSIPVILSAGRLVRQKDYPTLIRAFRLVRDARACRLLILGEGEERSALEELIEELGLEDDIDLPGFKRNPLSYLGRADLFVLSSAYEGFGNVIAESLALGVPVVATDCPHGPSEILEGGRFGKLVAVGDERGLAKAILEQLVAPVASDELKQRGAYFGIENAGKYLELMGLSSRNSS